MTGIELNQRLVAIPATDVAGSSHADGHRMTRDGACSQTRAEPLDPDSVRHRRRALCLSLAFVGAAGAAASALAQKSGSVPRIGVLRFGVPADDARLGLTAALAAIGYEDGKTIVMQWRWATTSDAARHSAMELAHMGLDLLVASATPAATALRDVHPMVPIVLASAADPVGSGLVASLGRPGGNITGVSLNLPEMVPKQLQLLHESIPDLQRVALLGSTLDKATPLFVEQARPAAQFLGVSLQVPLIAQADEFEAAAIRMQRAGVQAVVVQPLFTLGSSARLADALTRHRLPSVSALRPYAFAGGLMSYGPNRADIWRRAASFIDRLLKGAKPADLPVEEPTTFELAINLRTARALGMTLPRSVLLRVDELIE